MWRGGGGGPERNYQSSRSISSVAITRKHQQKDGFDITLKGWDTSGLKGVLFLIITVLSLPNRIETEGNVPEETKEGVLQGGEGGDPEGEASTSV